MKKSLLILSAILLLQTPVWAYDFEAQNDDEVTIYYNVTADTEVEVTYVTKGARTNSTAYVGNVEIPETVTNDDNTYTVTAIGDYTAYYCTDLTAMTMPESVTSVGYQAFYNCTSLTTMTIPDNVTIVGDYAFNFCSGLTSVTIGKGVESIGMYAFRSCTALESITSLNPEPPECQSNTFSNVPTSTCTLYVPIGSKDAYSSADYWSAFENIEETDGDGNEYTSPTFTLNDVTDMTYDSATLSATVTKGSEEITAQGFEYWTGDGEVQEVPVEGDELTATLTELAEGTTYTYHAYATTETATAYSEEKTFTMPTRPTVLTDDATNVTNNSATLNGSATGGSVSITVKGFEYWSDESEEMTVEVNEEGEEMSITITGLAEGTTYNYCTYAMTDYGTTYGDTLAFTTLNATLRDSLASAITDGQNALEDAWDTITTDCPDVADNYTGDYDAIKAELDDLSEALDNAYNDGTLNDELAEEMRASIEAINEEIEAMLDAAKEAQASYSLYAALADEVQATNDTLEEAWETITTDYADIADNYKDDYDAIKAELDDLSEELDNAYNDGTLTDEFAEELRAELEAINEEIEALLAAAKEAHETTSIDEVSIAGETEAIEVARYTIDGRQISAPQQGVNIILYSDGSAKKVIIK